MPKGKKSASKPRKRPIERYEHKDKTRINNPPVGLVTPETDPPLPTHKIYDYIQPVPTVKPGRDLDYDPHLEPQLVWAGKKEHVSFEVPTVSLHVHETIDPRTIIEAVRKRNGNGVPVQPSLFERPEEKLPLRDAIDFYKHAHGWSNRLIAGDSLLVMNSLLEKEGMAGQVQMIYIDPPYGIKYGSNFQPFVNKRDVRDGKDEDLTQEPEMIQAFRDTWELGIHSYLTYLRDRLLLARELLHESGSVFVQISDENVHLVRKIAGEVFGEKNFCSLVAFRKTAGANSPLARLNVLGTVADYLIWYARDIDKVKYRQLYRSRGLGEEGSTAYQLVQLPSGERRRMAKEELRNFTALPDRSRALRLDNLTSGGFSEELSKPYKFEGRTFSLSGNLHWKTTKSGMDQLAAASRITPVGNSLAYVRYIDDFPVVPLQGIWTDTATGGFGDEKFYVVQTVAKVIERCLLMTSDPGDLVFDPTCGSGTTAYVAEQWGRRWITCDTSRVAVTLAKQRLMTAEFDYYELAHPEEGVGSGFRYKTVPHVTLKSIANNPEIREGMTREQIDAAIAKYADQETLYDQPYADKTRVRVTGPFTVEAVPAPTVRSLEDVEEEKSRSLTAVRQNQATGFGMTATERRQGLATGFGTTAGGVGQSSGTGFGMTGVSADASVARKGATLRHTEWRDELLKTGLRGKGGHHIDFSRVEPLAGTRWLHADAETKGAKPERVVISFGPEFSLLESRQVELAWEEARTLSPKPSILVFAAFEFDPEAAKDIDGMTKEKTGMTFLTAQMNADLLTADLKKKRASNQGFWLVGRPDVEVRRATGEEIKQQQIPHRRSPKPGDRVRDDSGEVGSPRPGDRVRDDSGEVGSPRPGDRVRDDNETPTTGDAELYVAEVRGFDYYDTRTGTIESGNAAKIAMWLLDTDYDGRSLYPRQVFFPMADEDEGWSKLERNLKAEIDSELIEKYRGTVSLPFEIGANRRIAVKVIDDRGIESLKVVDLA